MGTLLKNRPVSNSSEKMMPTVVMMAMVEATIMMTEAVFSTLLRARMSGRTCRSATRPPPTISASMTAIMTHRLAARVPA